MSFRSGAPGICAALLLSALGCGGDDDVPSFEATVQVDDADGLVTTEAGGTASFSVTLSERPTRDVLVELSSSDPGEGTVSPPTLTLTENNWDTGFMVTVTGVDDQEADGDATYEISLDPEGGSGTEVSVTNEDNDGLGATVTPTVGLVTTESGGTATFSVALNTRPTAPVTIPVESDAPDEGTAVPNALVFTIDNWAAPQTVTVTGVDDDAPDGAVEYTVALRPATSADTSYAGFDADDVVLTNIDNDTAGIVVSPALGLTTTESGGTDTSSVYLTLRPAAPVTILLASNDPEEGSVSPTSIVFTPENWNAPRTVTVTGRNDDEADGPQAYSIVLAASTSSDSNYHGIDPTDVAVINVDNDSAGVSIAAADDLTTTESGGTATFTVVLNSQPAEDVTIPLSSSAPEEGTVSPGSLVFTPLNWSAPRTVTVTGANDDVADGGQPYKIVLGAAESVDGGYQGLVGPTVSLTNLDNDSPGVQVVAVGGLRTGEGGGSDTFEVVLGSQPTADVTITLASSAPDEAVPTPATLVFTAANWNAARTVTVTGVDDAVADGDQPYTILVDAPTSADTGYSALQPDDVQGVNEDDDSASIRVTPTSGLVTSESGGAATFSVVLGSQPTADVTVALASTAADEGTALPATLVFTAVNWNAPKVVTITGVDDPIDDGDQPYKILLSAATSADPGYDTIDPTDVDVMNLDNDSPGITVTAVGSGGASHLETSEAGGTATFEVVLDTQPSADVTIAVSSSVPDEGIAAPASLTFTEVNWNAPQVVTVTGVEDEVADGSQAFTIVLAPASSGDAAYDGLDPDDVQVRNVDNDSAGIRVTPVAGLSTSEAGGTATFDVVLDSQPTAPVTVTLSSNAPDEGTPSPTSLTFDAVNWNAPQTVTVTGADDSLDDGNQPYRIAIAAATSSDDDYQGIDPTDVELVNVDNDTPGVTLITGGRLLVSELGDTDTFTVRLNSQPTAEVTISLASADTTEATVSASSITFTPANWDVVQTITVTGVDDVITDGDQVFFVITGTTVSDDPGYQGLVVADGAVTNFDDDTASVVVTSPQLIMVSENGTTETLTLVLTTQPTDSVTCTVSSTDLTEGTVAPTSLVFTPANFDQPQTVTVTGVNDGLADGNQLFVIRTNPCTSADPSYSGFNPRNVNARNLDND